MTVIRATVRNGRIEVDAPAEFPDGAEVTVTLTPTDPPAGLTEADWDDSPEGIERWFRWLDSLQPLLLTEQEQALIDEQMEAQKAWEKAHFNERGDRIAKLWE